MVRRLVAQGESAHAANVAQYIEVRALGLTRVDIERSYWRRVYSRPCSVRGCTVPRGRNGNKRFCREHMPRFEKEAA
jgi:hypothetical protein